MSIPAYNPRDWYWIVGGDETRVYSSARGNFFPADDTAYQAWLAGGALPSRVDAASTLGEVLAPYNLRPTHAATLDGYTETQASKLTLEVVAKVLFWAANEIRVLKGQQPVTAPQFKKFLKGLM